MTEIINVISKVSYITLIVGSVFFGLSMAVELLIYSMVNKLVKNTQNNFDKIQDEDAKKKCLKDVNLTKGEFLEYLNQTKKQKKIEKSNKIRKFFKLKVKEQVAISYQPKKTFLSLIKSVAENFSNYDGKERGYLNFTERELFLTVNELKDRIRDIVESSGIFWFKVLKISTIITAIDLYNTSLKFFDKVWVSVIVSIINFFMWFARVFSIVSLSKYFFKDLAGNSLSNLLSNAVIEILGKEVAVLYYKKSTINLTKF